MQKRTQWDGGRLRPHSSLIGAMARRGLGPLVAVALAGCLGEVDPVEDADPIEHADSGEASSSGGFEDEEGSEGGSDDLPGRSEGESGSEPEMPTPPVACLGWHGDDPEDCDAEPLEVWDCELAEPCAPAQFVYTLDGAVEVDLEAARCIVQTMRWGTPSTLRWSWTDEAAQTSGRAQLHVVAEQFVLLDLETTSDAAVCDDATLRLRSGRAHVLEPLDPLYDRCASASTAAEFAACFFGADRPLDGIDFASDPPFPWLSGACDVSRMAACPGQ